MVYPFSESSNLIALLIFINIPVALLAHQGRFWRMFKKAQPILYVSVDELSFLSVLETVFIEIKKKAKLQSRNKF